VSKAVTIIGKLNISINSNYRRRGLVINAIHIIISRVNNYAFVLTKVKNNKFILDQAALNVFNHLKFYLRKYLYSKLVYPSGRSAWVWSNYVSVLPQARIEREALHSPPVPMAWVWSYYRPYLGFMTVKSDIRTDDLSTKPTVVPRTKFINQKKLSLDKTKIPVGRLTLMIFGAVIAIVLI
jgi:hypothetical protein